MGLFVGIVEFMLFVIFGATFAALVLTIIFGMFTAIFLAMGISLDFEFDEGTVSGAMAVWAVMLPIGGICSKTGNSYLWNVSPFGHLQDSILYHIQPYFLPAPHTWQNDYSEMWATFWSYCVVALIFSIIVVFLYRGYYALKESTRTT